MSTVDPNAPVAPTPEAPPLWLATFNSGHFDFTALGETRADVIEALRSGWEAHSRVYDADPALLEEAIRDGEVDYTLVAVGDCLRDGALLTFNRPTN